MPSTTVSMISRHLSSTPRWRPKFEIEWHWRHVGLVNNLISMINKISRHQAVVNDTSKLCKNETLCSTIQEELQENFQLKIGRRIRILSGPKKIMPSSKSISQLSIYSVCVIAIL